MENVYIVYELEIDGGIELWKIFSTKDKALDFISKQTSFTQERLIVEEMEVE